MSCAFCQKVCKNLVGLSRHIASCKKRIAITAEESNDEPEVFAVPTSAPALADKEQMAEPDALTVGPTHEEQEDVGENNLPVETIVVPVETLANSAVVTVDAVASMDTAVETTDESQQTENVII